MALQLLLLYKDEDYERTTKMTTTIPPLRGPNPKGVNVPEKKRTEA